MEILLIAVIKGVYRVKLIDHFRLSCKGDVDPNRTTHPHGALQDHLPVERFNSVHHIGQADPASFPGRVEACAIVQQFNVETSWLRLYDNIYIPGRCMFDNIVDLFLDDPIAAQPPEVPSV
jgi:hypothetical protein